MHPDLERVIALQRLDTSAHDAERRLADQPQREKALEDRIESGRQALNAAKERLADNANARRAIEKDVAVHQGRLSKFREQAMAVKTNQEYHAIQKEIAFAQGEVKTLEDGILERLLEADELTARVKQAEAALAAEQKAAEAERKALAAEQTQLKASLEKIAADRRELVAALDPAVLATFELVSSRRNGIGVAEARNGICTICHVRLRPQVFNTVLKNEAILQCDSCNRILFYVAPPTMPPAPNNIDQAVR